jgi:hypothetical protein
MNGWSGVSSITVFAENLESEENNRHDDSDGGEKR